MPFRSSLSVIDANERSLQTLQSGSSYCIGTVRKREDMQTSDLLLANICEIRKLTAGDFAFVRRKNGQWTYSKVVEISATNDNCKEQYIKFVLDHHRHTKTIPVHWWVKLIRLVKQPDIACEPTKRRVTWDKSLQEEAHCTENVRCTKLHHRVTMDATYQRLFLNALATIEHRPRHVASKAV